MASTIVTWRTWLEHRAAVLGCPTLEDLAVAAAMSPAMITRIHTRGLMVVSRERRITLARLLQVPLRKLEALAVGELAWIQDGDRCEHNPYNSARPDAQELPRTRPVRVGGVPLLGQVLAGGRVQVNDCWSPEEGPWVPQVQRYVTGVFGLRIDPAAAVPAWYLEPGDILLLRIASLHELWPGDRIVATTQDERAWFGEARTSSPRRRQGADPEIALTLTWPGSAPTHILEQHLGRVAKILRRIPRSDLPTKGTKVRPGYTLN